MPPKRKRPSSPTTEPPADTTTLTTSTTSAPTLDPSDAPPFLNTTFTTHRASPLHAATPLTQPRLAVLSQRLGDLLVGDVVRGIELERTDDGSCAGALEVVDMGWVRLEDLLGRYVDVNGEDDADTSLESALAGPGKRRALQVGLQYERGEYTALLLPALGEVGEDEDDDPEVLHLPLVLLRMPAPLKAVICGFLSRTFDCRISALSLGTRSLVGALECWLGEGGAPRSGAMGKDVVVTLGFWAPGVLLQQEKENNEPALHDDEVDETNNADTSMGIKVIDITIPLPSLRRFLKAGTAHEANHQSQPQDRYTPTKRRRLGGNKDEEAWTWRYASSPTNTHPRPQQPFTAALAAYLHAHLALDVFHPAVRVSRVACGGFVLSESRVKLFGVPRAPEDGDGGGGGGGGRDALLDGLQRAVWAVFGGLGERARVVRAVVESLV